MSPGSVTGQLLVQIIKISTSRRSCSRREEYIAVVARGMFKALIILVCIAIVGGAVYFLYLKPAAGTEFGTVTIGNKVFYVEVANTPAKREQGLSDRSSIGSDGMLFTFDSPARYGFWMKGMKFPLDFVWIRDGFVIQTDVGVQPLKQGEPPVAISPVAEVNYVLEVTEGTIQRYGIDRGSRVEISLPLKNSVQ